MLSYYFLFKPDVNAGLL